MSRIIKLLQNDAIKIRFRTEPPPYPLGAGKHSYISEGVQHFKPRKCFAAPEDITEFRNLVKEAVFFDKDGMRVNSWVIGNTDIWLYDTPFAHFYKGIGEDPEDEVLYLDNCFIFAQAFNDAEYLAIDLHEDRYGWIFLTKSEFGWENALYPVVAHSFTEWIQRTLDSGPYIRYWEREDFVDLGHAMPNHPNHRPANYRKTNRREFEEAVQIILEDRVADRQDCKGTWRTNPPLSFATWKQEVYEQERELLKGNIPPIENYRGRLFVPPRIPVRFGDTSIRIPGEVLGFCDTVRDVTLFEATPEKTPRNGWRLPETEKWLDRKFNEVIGLQPTRANPYWNEVYVLAFGEAGGWIAVDLHTERFGKIIYIDSITDLESGSALIIAKCIIDWLDRTVAAGPDVRYWEQDDFIGSGEVP